jgi:HK97 gp10 family phage protein
MTISQGITLYGKGAIMSNLYAMPDRMQRKAINRALKPAAAILRKQAKSMAPVGATGRLKRSIRVRALRGMPPAISVHPTYKIAPHKHLVHEGTKERTRKSIGGKFAYLGPNTSEATRSTGKIEGNPFFTDAWKIVQSRVSESVVENMWKIAKSSILRGGEARL